MKTIKEKVLTQLKRRWCSNAYLNRTCSYGSSSAERKAREIIEDCWINKYDQRVKHLKNKQGKIINTYYEWRVV